MKTIAIVGTVVAGVTLTFAAGAQPGGAAPKKEAMPDLPLPDPTATSDSENERVRPPPAEPAPVEPRPLPVAPPPHDRTIVVVGNAAPAAPERLPDVPSRDWHDVVGRLELGYRGVFVTNPGYNPFSTQDYFSGVSITVSRTVVSDAAFSFAPGLAWDYGSSASTARGDHASLMVHRLSVPLEGRLHAGAMGYAFVRLAPGVASEHIEVTDASAPTNLTKTQWLFATDASVGYALPVVPLPPRRGRAFRLWIVADGGYSWVADERLTPVSTVPSGGTPVVNQVDLGTLGLRGAFFRVAIAASY